MYQEQELLSLIASGDEVAFKIFFDQHHTKLYTYLFKITKSKEVAEEILMDVFLKLWTGRSSIQEIINIDAFLGRVAHNKAIDFLRSVQRNPLLQQHVWNDMQEPLAPEEADHSLITKNIEEIISTAITSLSPQRRKVFQLHYNNGYTNEEISESLHLSKNTVKNHLSASVDFVRKFVATNLNFILFLSLFKKIF